MQHMNEPCQYKEICANYTDDCLSDDYWTGCDTYRTFESILDKQVFKTRIWKRILREEHGHKEDELPKQSWTDSNYLDK